MAYDKPEDKKMMQDALNGVAPAPEPHPFLNFAVPTEGGGGSGSGSDEGQPSPPPPPPPVTATGNALEGGSGGTGAGGASTVPIPPPEATVSVPVIQRDDTVDNPIVHQGAQAAGAAASGGPVTLPLPPPGAPVAPSDYRGIELARQAQANAIASGVTAPVPYNAKINEITRGEQEAENVEKTFQAQSNAKAEADLAAYQGRIKDRLKKIDEGSIDPDNFWKSRNDFQKVAAITGLALGGFLQGFKGGPNPANEMINQAIGRDIEAQKENAAKDRYGLETENNLYAQNLAQFKDDKTAQQATLIEMREQAKQQIDAVASQSKNAQAVAEAQKQIADLDLQNQQAMFDLGQKHKLRTLESDKMERQKAAQGLVGQAEGISNTLKGEISQIKPGPNYYKTQGLPVPKEAAPAQVAAGTKPAGPGAAATATAQATPTPTPATQKLKTGQEKDLISVGTANVNGQETAKFLLPFGAKDAQGNQLGRVVYSDGKGGYIETDQGEAVPTKVASTKQGQGPRFTSRAEHAELQGVADDLETILPGLKFGEEGAKARARYDMIQKSELGRRYGLPELDVSSPDAFDHVKGALEEATQGLKRRAAEQQKLFDEYGNAPASAAPSTE